MLVFFFKQKTAYEMRISDWSSDVCSSDLTPQNIVIGGAAGAFPPLIGWAAATGDISTLPALLFALIFLWTPPHFWSLALFIKSDSAKIGRASCRARVCQYVQLSVVAVSLKHKSKRMTA